MVSFKKLLLVTSLLIGEIAAVPTTSVERDVAGLEKRVLHAGTNANNIIENETVSALQVKNNGGQATITDLTGCTGVFFYMGTTLRSVSHILCGNEKADAKTAAQAAAGADSVSIGASSQTRFNDAQAGVLAGKPGIRINAAHIYKIPTDKTKAATLHAQNGAFTIIDGTGPKVSKQQPS